MTDRPISPSIQHYRPQLTSVLSVSHRATGVVLSAGAPLLVIWLLSAAMGPAALEAVHAALASWPGLALLFLWTFCLFYHLLNGIRHLCWDAHFGLSLAAVYTSGWTVVVASVLLTLVAWFASSPLGAD